MAAPHILKLLGGVSLAGPDGPFEGRVVQRRRLALLALLAVARGRPLSRDKVIATLWPESPAERARHSLSDALHALHKTLGERAIVAAGDELRLDPAMVASDVAAFEAAVEGGDLERAVDLYGGPFLDGFFISGAVEFDDWAATERERLARVYRGALERLAESASAAGDPRRAAAWWRRLCVEESDNSRAVLGLMAALAAAGDRAGALRQAEEHATHLREEYGAEPDPTVTELARRLQEEPDAWVPTMQVAEAASRNHGQNGRKDQRAGRRGALFSTPVQRGALVGASAFILLLLLAGLYSRSGDEAAITASQASTDTSLTTHRQITFAGRARIATVSPDGRTIAYAAWSGKLRDDDHLYVQDLSGGQPVEIGRYDQVFQIRWSPTGESLLISARQLEDGKDASHILLLPRLGGSARAFPYASLFDWSPDGERFVFAWLDEKRLWFQEIATGDTTSVELPDSFARLQGVDWSARGDQIAYATKEDSSRRYAIWTIGVSGEGARKVVEDTLPMRSPRWSSTGDAVYYLQSRFESQDLLRVEVSSSTGEATTRPWVVMTGLNIGDFDLFDDGRRILYSRSLIFSNLWRITPRGSGESEVIQLTTGTAWKGSFSVSPDGRHVAIAVGWPHSNIHILPVEGGPMKQITHLEGLNGNPAWSPDGSEIAFSSTHGGRARVWKVPVEGGTPQPFEETQISPDSRRALAWAPGSQILYHRPGNRNFHLLDPGTGNERPLVSNEEVGWMFQPHYSPDGTMILVHWSRDPTAGLWIVSLTDGKQTLIAEGDIWPAGWSPDGRSVYAAGLEGIDSPLTRYSITGRDREIISPLLGCGNGLVVFIGMTPDAKRFLCVGREWNSDLWIAENFDPRAQERVATSRFHD